MDESICGLIFLIVLAYIFIVGGWYSQGSITGSRLQKKFKYMPRDLSYEDLERMLMGHQTGGAAQPVPDPKTLVKVEEDERREDLT